MSTIPTFAPEVYVKDAAGKFSTPTALGNLIAPGTNGLSIDTSSGKFLVTGSGTTELRPHNIRGTATAGMTTITLGKTPVVNTDGTDNGRPKVIRNNTADVSHAFTWVGNVGTYNPALNLGCEWDDDDTFAVHYEAAV